MTYRILVAIDVRDDQVIDEDTADLCASIEARVKDEAGYLEPDGAPITPVDVTVSYVEVSDELPQLTPAGLAGIYEVGVEGLR